MQRAGVGHRVGDGGDVCRSLGEGGPGIVMLVGHSSKYARSLVRIEKRREEEEQEEQLRQSGSRFVGALVSCRHSTAWHSTSKHGTTPLTGLDCVGQGVHASGGGTAEGGSRPGRADYHKQVVTPCGAHRAHKACEGRLAESSLQQTAGRRAQAGVGGISRGSCRPSYSRSPCHSQALGHGHHEVGVVHRNRGRALAVHNRLRQARQASSGGRGPSLSQCCWWEVPSALRGRRAPCAAAGRERAMESKRAGRRGAPLH